MLKFRTVHSLKWLKRICLQTNPAYRLTFVKHHFKHWYFVEYLILYMFQQYRSNIKKYVLNIQPFHLKG